MRILISAGEDVSEHTVALEAKQAVRELFGAGSTEVSLRVVKNDEDETTIDAVTFTDTDEAIAFIDAQVGEGESTGEDTETDTPATEGETPSQPEGGDDVTPGEMGGSTLNPATA